MKITELTLENFRNFENYHISFGNKITIFIGRNGMGKTNIIAGLVKALSFIFSKQRGEPQSQFIRSTDQSVKSFDITDARYVNGDYNYPIILEANGNLSSSDKMKASLMGLDINWSFHQESKTSGLKDSLFRYAYHQFWDYYTDEPKPVLAYFSDSFPHKDTNVGKSMKEKLKSGNPLPAGDGYYQWDKEQSCVNIWKKYYAQLWMNSNLKKSNTDNQTYIDAVNQKLCAFTKDFVNPVIGLEAEYRFDEATLLVCYEDGSNKPFDTLPAGYKRIYSMVLDIVSRSYLLNKNADPEGIVFIDEIELHLHPSLAAVIVERFHSVFPRIQFIISTHSPVVISNFNQNEGEKDDYRLINLLKDDEGYYYRIIEDIYGLDYNASLTEIMDTPQSKKYQDDMVEAYLYWLKKDKNKAYKIAEILKQAYGPGSKIIKDLGL